jgi:hypothetical protein|tara:strand:+ start:700 stop:990 length:291 start_codon:yes stop_codon:yes gene_type:complete
MKTLNVAIGMFFTMAFMGAGCVSIFASIYLAMAGDLWGALAAFILCIGCWVLMLITLNDVMMRAEYPSFFTGNRKATPFDVVATGSCGVEAQEREL